MRKRGLLLKSVALGVTFSLIFPNPAWANRPPESVPIEPEPPSGIKDFSNLKIPPDWGKIYSLFEGKQSQRVVLIQDAHGVPEAQKNIANLIRHFESAYGTKLVAVEGSSSRWDFQLFHSFPDQRLLKKILRQYQEKSELSGAMDAAIFPESKSSQTVFRGVESQKLYQEGLIHYLKSLEQEKAVRKFLRSWEDKLRKKKDEFYPPLLGKVDQAVIDFSSNHKDLASLLKELSGVKRPRPGSQIALILEEISREETSLDGFKGELLEAAAKLKNVLGNGERIQLNRMLQEFNTSQKSAHDFGLVLQELAGRHNVALNFSGKLQELIVKQRRIRDLENEQLIQNVKDYIKEVKTFLIQTKTQKEVDRETETLELLKKLSRLELTREDWNEVKKLQQTNLIDWTAFSHPCAFYQNAEAREVAIFGNLIKGMRKRDAILVAGGFHTEGIRKHLETKGIRYILITPKIKNLPEKNRYPELMQGKVSWQGYFRFEGGRLSFYRAFVRALRDRLLEGSNRKVYSWRDRLIHDLADQRRLAEAHRYTLFLDEVADAHSSNDSYTRDWLANIEKFMAEIRRLKAGGELTEQAFYRLLNLASRPPDVFDMGIRGGLKEGHPFARVFLTPATRHSLHEQSSRLEIREIKDDYYNKPPHGQKGGDKKYQSEKSHKVYISGSGNDPNIPIDKSLKYGDRDDKFFLFKYFLILMFISMFILFLIVLAHQSTPPTTLEPSAAGENPRPQVRDSPKQPDIINASKTIFLLIGILFSGSLLFFIGMVVMKRFLLWVVSRFDRAHSSYPPSGKISFKSEDEVGAISGLQGKPHSTSQLIDSIIHQAQKGNEGALEGLGFIYLFARVDQQKEIRDLLTKTPPDSTSSGAFLSLARIFNFDSSSDKSMIYNLLKSAASTNSKALRGLALLYPSDDLHEHQKKEILDILGSRDLAKDPEALAAYAYVLACDPVRLGELMYELFHSGIDLKNSPLALGYLYPYLNSEEQEEAYQYLKDAVQMGPAETGHQPFEAAALVFPYLNPMQRTDLFLILDKIAPKNSAADRALALTQLAPSQPAVHLGLNWVEQELKKDNEHTYYASCVILYVTIMGTYDAKSLVWPKSGNIEAKPLKFQKQLAAEHLIQNFEEKHLGSLEDIPHALALAAAYPALGQDAKDEAYVLFRVGAQAGYPEALIAGGMIFRHLTYSQAIEMQVILRDKAEQGSEAALEALGYVLTSGVFHENAPKEEKEVVFLLINKAKEGNPGALRALAHATPIGEQLTYTELMSLIETYGGDEASSLTALANANLYSAIMVFLGDEVEPIGSLYASSMESSKPMEGQVLLALGILLGPIAINKNDPERGQKMEKIFDRLLEVAQTKNDPYAYLGLAEAYPFLSGIKQQVVCELLEERASKAEATALRALAMIYAHAKQFQSGLEEFMKALQKKVKPGQAIPIHGTHHQAHSHPATSEKQPLRGASQPGLVIAAITPITQYTHAEFDPSTGDVVQVNYQIGSLDSEKPAPNPALQDLMRRFDLFENLNFEVLTLLNKPNKTIGDFHKLLFLLEQMTKLYLNLFKGQAMDTPLESIAAAPSELSGGRAIAQTYLRIKEELYQKLKQLQPGQTSTAPLNEGLETMLQRFDGEKTTRLIGIGAERYNPDVIAGISFAELINIVHQKGVRNLTDSISQTQGSKRTVSLQIGRENDDRTYVLPLIYFDARSKPDAQVPLPVQYAARAFAKGQAIHGNHHLFPPSKALVLSDEKRAIIGMKLGVHSARIQFALMPVQEGGRVVVNYTDSGASYAPGSNIRIAALAEALRSAGFKVNVSGYSLDAYFDKDSGASSIDELYEKLEFAIQVLTSTKDLDLAINRSDLRDDPSAAQKIAAHFIANGYLERAEIRQASFGVPSSLTSEPFRRRMAEEAAILGLPLQQEEGQRMLDRIQRRKTLLLDRGAITLDGQGRIQKNPAYEEAAKNSPLGQFLGLIEGASPERITLFRQTAVIAKTVENFSERRVIGEVGQYEMIQLVLPLLGDQVTFYVLKDSESDSFYLAWAVLGEFPLDRPRYDRFRGKELPHNSLGLTDLEEILAAQNMAESETLKAWAAKLGEEYETICRDYRGTALVFHLLRETHFVDRVLPPFFDALLFATKPHRQKVSVVSIGGISINQGRAMGRAILNAPDREPASFENGILIAAYTEPPDDPKIKNSNGIVVTTGGVLSHAAIRSREHRKPALLLNGAEVSAQGLKFRRFRGKEKISETLFNGRQLSYYELSDYGEEDQWVKDGDLIYIDAVNGVLYVLASAEDKSSLALYGRYVNWKKSGGDLLGILNEIENENLLRAILDEILHDSTISQEELDRIFQELSKDPRKKAIIFEFLRLQAANAVEGLQTRFVEYKQTLKTTHDAEQVFLMVDDLISRAQRLERLLKLANGNWREEFTVEDLHKVIQEVIYLGRQWLEAYREKLIAYVKNFQEDPVNGLLSLLRISAKLCLVGISMEAVRPDLARRIQELQKSREEEIEKKKGRGVVRKRELKDRFSRPIAGGKGANSAEIIHALESLKAAGVIPETVGSVNGFVIQPEEYRLWDTAGRLPMLDEELKRELAHAYRDLVVSQAEQLLSSLETDYRTNENIKRQLVRILERTRTLSSLQELLAIDTVILVSRDAIHALLENCGPQDISLSLRNRLQVFGAVAVRSSGLREDSAEEAMAGMKETKLNVFGLDGLYQAVIDVWSSGSEGVLVDEMINPKVSGVAFSADPVSKSTDLAMVIAAYGLAKGLVDQKHGVSDPDSYLIQRPEGLNDGYKIIDTHIGEKAEMVILDNEGGTRLVPLEGNLPEAQIKQKSPALTEEQIKMVAQVAAALAQFFGFQGDMEFSFDSDDHLVPLQFRPITTLRESIDRGREALMRDEIRKLGEKEWSDRDSVLKVTRRLARRLRPGIPLASFLLPTEAKRAYVLIQTDPGRFQIFLRRVVREEVLRRRSDRAPAVTFQEKRIRRALDLENRRLIRALKELALIVPDAEVTVGFYATQGSFSETAFRVVSEAGYVKNVVAVAEPGTTVTPDFPGLIKGSRGGFFQVLRPGRMGRTFVLPGSTKEVPLAVSNEALILGRDIGPYFSPVVFKGGRLPSEVQAYGEALTVATGVAAALARSETPHLSPTALRERVIQLLNLSGMSGAIEAREGPDGRAELCILGDKIEAALLSRRTATAA